MNPLEVILRLLAQAEPQPWFPKRFAAEQQADLNQIYLILELLHLEGLVATGPGHPEYGPGVVLTPAGRALLADEAKLQRLRDGRPLAEGDRGGEVRSVLRKPPDGRWTRVIVWANVAVFAYACLLAYQIPGALSAYAFTMTGLGVPPSLLHAIGAVRAVDLLGGEYWRLLTCCFAHLGVLHLAMNMFALRGSGPMTERMYGGWQYALLYLAAGWGGACTAMAYAPTTSPPGHPQIVIPVTLLGASGAVCGVIAAEGAWFFLNRRHLPRSAFGRFAGGFITTVILMVVISLLPGVSGWGHLGGALFGLAAALLLQAHRYGPAALRVPALALVLLLPVGGYALLQHGMATEPAWAELQIDAYADRPEAATARRTFAGLDARYEKDLLPVLEKHAQRRTPGEAAAGLAAVASLAEEAHGLEATFAVPGPWSAPAVVEFRAAALALSRAWLAYLDEVRRGLEAGPNWTREDDKNLGVLFRALEAADEAWKKAGRAIR